ncbi:MAG: ATP-dependent RNA helicase [Spirochaetia bacterium]|nr:ATP-dependent RNA helicase [Spirochaetia bacterium]
MKDMSHLPVYQHRQEIIDSLNSNQVIVVESPTGSGKTTQIPLILHDAGFDNNLCIGITQPRRIATLSVCDFIKKQIDDKESFVGYKMRFSDTTTQSTKIKIMTDGILLMELKSDPLLKNYSIILVDEAHERSLNIDFILGMLKQVIVERPEFKVVISSATINTKKFSAFFNNCPIVSIKSKLFPIEEIYINESFANDDVLNNKIVNIVKENVKDKTGDILIFLPGEYDIKTCMKALIKSDPEEKLMIYPLYGRLSKEEQESVFDETPFDKTKVVVSTNIAETSITIDNIATVIDSGLAKINFYNQKNFTSSLITLPISKSSAMQRRGRSGRTKSGKCYRLYSKKSYASRDMYTLEEILRTDLSEVVLRMSDLGIYDYEHFPFITRPNKDAIKSAENTLKIIDAIDDNRRLTKIGEFMVKFPLLPRHSRVVVEAIFNYPSVINEVLIAIAFLSSKTPFVLPPDKVTEARNAHKAFNNERYGDFASYLTLYKTYESIETKTDRMEFCKNNYLDFQSMQEIVHIVEQLGEIISDENIPLTGSGSMHDYICCIASGLKQFICVKEYGYMYNTLFAKQIFIHPGSADFRNLPKYLVAGELVQTSRLFARSVSPILEDWLDDIQKGLKYELDDKLANVDSNRNSNKKKKQSIRERENPVELNQKSGSVTIYSRNYKLLKVRSGKKEISIARIPYEDIDYLSRKHFNSKKPIQNIKAEVIYQNKIIQRNGSFYSLLALAQKYDNPNTSITFIPRDNFSVENVDDLISNFDKILKLTPQGKNQYYFIKLHASRDNIFFYEPCKDYSKALNDTLFALLELIEDLKQVNDRDNYRKVQNFYYRLLKLLDD